MGDIKRVTLYKIKPGTSYEELLKGALDSYARVQNVEDGYEAYIKFQDPLGKERTEDEIPWLRFLNSGFEEKKYTHKARNRFPRAVMALRVRLVDGSHPIFVATFGQHGDSFFEKAKIVYDFGIKVGMNICDMDGLRRLQTTVHESISKQTERQASVGTSLSVFGINTDSEFLRTISGHVRLEFADVVESFKGKDSIAIKLPKDAAFSWSDMAEICRRFEERYASADYRDTEFRSYDNLRHESDPVIVEALDEALCAKVMAKDFTKVHLAPPEFVEVDDLSYAYSAKDGDNVPVLFDDLRIEDLVALPRRRLKNVTTETLRGWRIYRYDAEQDATFPLWSAYQCLVAEVTLGAKTFVLTSGHWREVSAELRQRVDDYFRDHVFLTDFPYLPSDVEIFDPARGQNREERYNSAVAANDVNAFLFDKAKIEIAGKRVYEICDLMHGDKHFVHVKKYSSGAASISHVFTQAKLYADAFSTDEATRSSMLTFIQEDNTEINRGKDKAHFAQCVDVKTSELNDRDYTVVFCVLHREDEFDLAKLPFMSQYELMLAHKFLTENRRFQVGLVFRKVTYGGSGS